MTQQEKHWAVLRQQRSESEIWGRSEPLKVCVMLNWCMMSQTTWGCPGGPCTPTFQPAKFYGFLWERHLQVCTTVLWSQAVDVPCTLLIKVFLQISKSRSGGGRGFLVPQLLTCWQLLCTACALLTRGLQFCKKTARGYTCMKKRNFCVHTVKAPSPPTSLFMQALCRKSWLSHCRLCDNLHHFLEHQKYSSLYCSESKCSWAGLQGCAKAQRVCSLAVGEQRAARNGGRRRNRQMDADPCTHQVEHSNPQLLTPTGHEKMERKPGWHYRIMESEGLEGTSRNHQVQPPCCSTFPTAGCTGMHPGRFSTAPDVATSEQRGEPPLTSWSHSL